MFSLLRTADCSGWSEVSTASTTYTAQRLKSEITPCQNLLSSERVVTFNLEDQSPVCTLEFALTGLLVVIHTEEFRAKLKK